MDKQELNRYIAMTLIAIGRNGSPNSHAWMLVDPQMADLDVWTTIIAMLEQVGIVKQKAWFLTLTEVGLSMLTKVEEALAKASASKSVVL